MAISFIQFTEHSNSSGTSVSATFTNPIAAGSIIVVAGMFDPSSATTVTVTNDKGDAVTDSGLGLVLNGAGPTKSFVKAFLTATTGAQTVTATYNASVAYEDFMIWEVGGLTGAVFDKVVTASDSSNPASSGSTGTLSASAEAAIGYATTSGGFSAPGSGWTQDTINGNGSIGEHQVLASNTAISATGSQSGTAQIWCATFMSGGGAASIPFINKDWQLPTAPSRIDQSWAWRQTRMLGQDRLPNRQQDWPNPTQPWRLDQFLGWRQTRMFGQDRLPNRQQDWPNPTQPWRLDETWVWTQTRMFGQDRLPNRQQDWPVPPLHTLSRIDPVWTWRQTGMFGQDKLPFRQQDWPNPSVSPFFDRTWVSGFSNLLQGAVVVTFPRNQYDWPNPSQPSRIDQTWAWSQTKMFGQDRLPNRQQDWPNATQPSRIDQTWSWSQTKMFGRDVLPFRQQDWPNPIQPPRIDPTWLQGFSNTLSAVIVLYPHNQYDWPNPVQPSRLDQFWSRSQMGMLGQDQLPNRQQDWPNPIQPDRFDRSWYWNQTGMSGQDRLPNRQSDWPLPALHLLPRIDPTFISGFTLVLEGSVIQPRPPFTNPDWPVPLGHQMLFQPQRGFASPPGINILPPPPPLVTKVIYSKQFFAVMGGMMSIPGDPPS